MKRTLSSRDEYLLTKVMKINMQRFVKSLETHFTHSYIIWKEELIVERKITHSVNSDTQLNIIIRARPK
jgi:hypothetical protein